MFALFASIFVVVVPLPFVFDFSLPVVALLSVLSCSSNCIYFSSSPLASCFPDPKLLCIITPPFKSLKSSLSPRSDLPKYLLLLLLLSSPLGLLPLFLFPIQPGNLQYAYFLHLYLVILNIAYLILSYLVQIVYNDIILKYLLLLQILQLLYHYMVKIHLHHHQITILFQLYILNYDVLMNEQY